MNAFLASARLEMMHTRRTRTAHLLLFVFLGMVSVSSIIGWVTNDTVTRVYEQIRADGFTTEPNPFTDVTPLYYARNSVIYVVLIGALMAIVLGVQATLRDRKAGTTDLVLSRPVSTVARIGGQLAGLGVVVATVLAISTTISWIAIGIISGGPLGPAETWRLIAFAVLSWALLLGFVVLGMIAGLYSRHETTALLVPFVVWSVITFAIPQLGTAAHPVALLNPVPAVPPAGGFFDVVATVTGPLAITEQFKHSAGLILGDASATGNLAPGVILIASALAAVTVAVVSTPRQRLRRALNE